MNNQQNSPPISDYHQHNSYPEKNYFTKECLILSDPLKDYISKEDFMSLFGIKRGLYYKLVNKGSLKIYNVGSKSFLRKSEIDKALKNHQLK